MTTLTADYPRFHLAFPVTDLEATRAFYGGTLGCGTGRESDRWIDFDFFDRKDSDRHRHQTTDNGHHHRLEVA